MPARNTRKLYQADGYYHIYNRGVEKREIFVDQQDYAVFLSYLKTYLLPKDTQELQKRLASKETSLSERDKVLKELRMNNFADAIRLLSFGLMPNHFHFLLKQTAETAIDQFLNSLGTRYVMFFNKKYQRVGPLYQGVYKAVLVETDEQLLHLSRYIHRNSLPLYPQLPQGEALQMQPSSYPEYLGERTAKWIHPEEILKFFSSYKKGLTYEDFVLQKDSEQDILPVKGLAIDED